MENNKIAVIGAGSMGGAILSGLIAAGTATDSITASTATTQSAKALSDKFGIKSFALDASPSANSDATENADVLLIAVKPAKVLETLEEIKASVKDGALVISVAAGVTTESMEQAIGSKASVIRAMPNTPSIVGHGVTGIAKGKSANDNQLALAKDLFETVGQVIVVDEEKINALSTISGSGPAYVFYFAEKLITAAKELGFTQKEADQMVRATFLGSATLLAASSETPEALRAQVTSPNGTTMEATNTFDAYNVEGTIQMATRAALARAIELGKNKS
jgi:pyrroline-5-carboxylate reductase